MSEHILAKAESYYKAMGEKNLEGVEKYLHPDVTFIAPLAQTQGKQEFLEATKGFMEMFSKTIIRAKFGSEEQQQAVVIYDIQFPNPIGNLKSAAYLTFQEGLIKKIELFYDARTLTKV